MRRLSEFVKDVFDDYSAPRRNEVIGALLAAEAIYTGDGLCELILGNLNYDQVLEG